MENVIAELTELHDSMTCDKPLVDFNDDLDNVELWNNLLYKLRKEVNSFIFAKYAIQNGSMSKIVFEEN